jgi:pyruvate/2-oxoglutarate dehydrogenase complex dihydrolipoamide dehydrogenase (E3) component
MRINKKDFIALIDKQISVIDNFTPLKIENNVVIGNFYNNTLKFNFDKVIIAIGREPIILENLSEKEIQIIPEKSAIETIAETLKQLKGLNI